MTLSPELLQSMQSIDPGTVNIESLPDASGVCFDNSLPRRERAARMIAHFTNPYCFRFGEMAVKVEYTDGGPSLQEVLSNLFLRQKSGL